MTRRAAVDRRDASQRRGERPACRRAGPCRLAARQGQVGHAPTDILRRSSPAELLRSAHILQASPHDGGGLERVPCGSQIPTGWEKFLARPVNIPAHVRQVSKRGCTVRPLLWDGEFQIKRSCMAVSVLSSSPANVARVAATIPLTAAMLGDIIRPFR